MGIIRRCTYLRVSMAQDLGANQTMRVADTVLLGIEQEQTWNILWTSILLSPGIKSPNIFSFFQTPRVEISMSCTNTQVILAFLFPQQMQPISTNGRFVPSILISNKIRNTSCIHVGNKWVTAWYKIC